MSIQATGNTTNNYYVADQGILDRSPRTEKSAGEGKADTLGYSKPDIETPQPTTWPGANSLMSDIGEIMLLLAKVGIALRDQQREQTKIHHDSAVQALQDSASKIEEQSKTALKFAIISAVVSVGFAALGGFLQYRANSNMKSINTAQQKINGIDDNISAIKSQGPITRAQSREISTQRASIAEQQAIITKSTSRAGYYNNGAMASTQLIMGSGQVVGGIGESEKLAEQAEEKQYEAISQGHQKASDLASQDYSEMEKFRSNLVDSLKQIVNLLNEVVKTTTQV